MKFFLIAVCLSICQLWTFKCDAAVVPGGVVEIYVAIDQRVIKDYMSYGSTNAGAENDAKREAEYFLKEASKIIKSTGTNIEFRVRRMDVLTEEMFSDCLLRDGNSIHEDIGLQTFERYVKAQGLFTSINYDLALLWTGYNIYGKSDITAGYATVGTVCKENAVTIVEYDGTYRTVHVVAHEIGHVLGLNHDQDTCNDGYIMAESLSYSAKRWSFSPCSIQALSQLIPQQTCITNTHSESKIPDEAASDDLMDVNKVCQRATKNAKSYLCKSSNLYNGGIPQGDIVCERIYCFIPEKQTCALAYTTNGIICGVGQRCLDGKCAAAPADFPTPPELKADCLFGDVGSLTINDQKTTCSDYFALAENRHQCTSPSLAQACCRTCQSLKGDIPGCPYGDGSDQCVHYSQNAICPNYKDTLCCEHCHGWRSKRSGDDDTNPPALTMAKLDKVTPEKVAKENEANDSNTTE